LIRSFGGQSGACFAAAHAAASFTLRHGIQGMNQSSILVVDDEPGAAERLCAYLQRCGYRVFAAADGAAMQRQLAAHSIDLVLLDLMLPASAGLGLAQSLRAKSRVPLIMLTARCTPADRVIGLELGADDYMSKPFEPTELIARIRSVLRRSRADAAAARQNVNSVSFDGWRLQHQERRLTSPAGQDVALSAAEYQLLATFLRSPRQVIGRAQLMSQARGRALQAVDRSIDLLVSRLRQKLQGEGGAAELIKTVRGAGYVFSPSQVRESGAWQH
jgi:two-component system OmpR family response regulator